MQPFYHLRIKNGIKQVHISDRSLLESELKILPEYAWIDRYYIDKDWSINSWLKQYDRKKHNRKE